MNRLPPLRLLTIFDAVQRLGTMQAAAGEMNVTRPAVSQAMRALEDQIGVPLMDRSTKPARMTVAGTRLAQATRAGLGGISDVIEDIRVSAGLGGRHVTVSCTLGMATHWLMPRLAGFYARYPEIMVNVQAPPGDAPGLGAGVDIALRYGARPWADGPTRKLFDERVCPVAAPEVITGLAADPHLLSCAPLIHVRAPRSLGWAGWPEYLAAKGLPRAQGSGQVFDNYIQAAQAALQGRGVMLGWRSITAALVAEGRLSALPAGDCDLGTAYWVTRLPDGRNRASAGCFMDWIVATSRAEAQDVRPAL